MYAELALMKLFVCEGEVELPEEVKEDKELNRNRKKLVAELEVCFKKKEENLFSYDHFYCTRNMMFSCGKLKKLSQRKVSAKIRRQFHG